jgi:hypothetical protein
MSQLHTLRARLVAVGIAVAVFALAACGGSSKPKNESPAVATPQITAIWQAFFGPAGTGADVQGATSAMISAYAKAKTGPLGKGAAAKVLSITLLGSSSCTSDGVPPPCASLKYDVLVNGADDLPNATGYATDVTGKWLVAKSSFCGLMALESATPAGC